LQLHYLLGGLPLRLGMLLYDRCQAFGLAFQACYGRLQRSRFACGALGYADGRLRLLQLLGKARLLRRPVAPIAKRKDVLNPLFEVLLPSTQFGHLALARSEESHYGGHALAPVAACTSRMLRASAYVAGAAVSELLSEQAWRVKCDLGDRGGQRVVAFRYTLPLGIRVCECACEPGKLLGRLEVLLRL